MANFLDTQFISFLLFATAYSFIQQRQQQPSSSNSSRITSAHKQQQQQQRCHHDSDRITSFNNQSCDGVNVNGESVKNHGDDDDDFESFNFRPIGKISSIYKLCVGTPRQGMLAPHSRGYITLNTSISADAVSDLAEYYTHVWIVWVFHLNTTSKKKSGNHHGNNKKNNKLSKIAPPALGGKKVGIFNTRTPHRPSNIGLSLVKLEKVERIKGQATKVHLSGLDLVDGTPVLDIKPFVPHYDTVGFVENVNGSIGAQVPSWVSSGLMERRPVNFSNEAAAQLEDIVVRKKGLQFYKGKNAYEDIKACIIEVLGVDVRSSWQTAKARKGRVHAERAIKDMAVVEANTNDNDDSLKEILCTQQLDNLLIYFSTSKPTLVESSVDYEMYKDNTGCRDTVEIRRIEQLNTIKQSNEREQLCT